MLGLQFELFGVWVQVRVGNLVNVRFYSYGQGEVLGLRFELFGVGYRLE